ncbi:molybdopterin converting factor subunit 1 [Uliginosibacterium sediminicola]|uniref:Molybdopterin synthase sulfur carrier subunit n=1 Tax=Uliginosibacterium sediminicola TaxID=2024550 RepID=A0ABU9YV96_9RHOO
MSLNLLYFASLREALGVERENLPLPAEATIAGVRALLVARGGEWQRLASPRIRAALNQALAGEDAALKAGDELAFFPPVTGG